MTTLVGRLGWAAAAVLVVPVGSALAQDNLRLARVLLSTGGVGYFEYEARVEGDTNLSFDVRLDQVDDVLKSVVVYDDQGGVGEVTLPGQEPLREIFRELPFDPGSLSSLTALLDALRGAEVRVSGPRAVTGRIVSVTEEVVQLPDGRGIVTRHRLTLSTPEGLRQMVLEEIDALEFVDPSLQAQIDEALAALADLNERDRRTLTVRMTGTGSRTVRVAYVVEVPLWKSTYRLTLSSDPAAAAAELQGWAVLENLSGEDWQGVDLSVVSGNPVTFRQALYAAYYVARPEVPVEVLGRVLPGIDEGAIPQEEYGRVAMAPPPPPMPTAAAEMAAGAVAYDMVAPTGGTFEMEAPQQFAQLQAAESSEATTQVLFRFPQPITVESGHTLLVPIISREIPAERLSLYDPNVHATNPLASVRLTNAETGLPPGVLTLYERDADSGVVSYVGDARLGAFPPGEERLISFAVDQKVTVDRTDRATQSITRARIVNGLLELTITDRNITDYVIDGAAEEERLILVEHPRLEGWRLTAPPAEQVETTPDAYRIRQPVPAGETVPLTVVLERPRLQAVELINLSANDIAYYGASTELPDDVRQAVSRLAAFQDEVKAREQALDELNFQVRQIVDDQQRVRQNLDSVPQDSDLFQRYLDRLAKEEDELERLNAEIEAARQRLEAARQALAEYVRGLRLG